MHVHKESRALPYSPAQMFDLVADIERYPEFLPWCTGAHIREPPDEGGVLVADLVIGYGPLHETFTSRVALERPRRIDVVGIKGPFRHLENHWTFAPAKGDGCVVDFTIDFAFKSFLLQTLMAAMFARSVSRMVQSFEARARERYGPPKTARRARAQAVSQNLR